MMCTRRVRALLCSVRVGSAHTRAAQANADQEHHDLSVATTHVALDDAVLKGKTEVKPVAEEIITSVACIMGASLSLL